jgi:predicted DNA-binding protein (MmcQ/YjbR family)
MNADEIIAYCLNNKNAYIDYPFGDTPICVKVQNKIFAQVYPNPNDFKITLKCDPMFGDFYRQMYPNTVVRGYHCPPVQQPYWNTIYINGYVSDDILKLMIDHAYKAVISKLPRKVQKELQDS